MKTPIYHIALMKGSGKCYPLHRNGHNADTLIIQAQRDIDCLSPDIWLYMGTREITKKELKENAPQIMKYVNEAHNTNFTRVIVE